ncbi:MAG: hypothetical protein DWI02_02405 [Planctomycetota bacterium]|nr:MAG: hypothetical protein DWI02_02405 [Planctomycetota bacterium]
MFAGSLLATMTTFTDAATLATNRLNHALLDRFFHRGRRFFQFLFTVHLTTAWDLYGLTTPTTWSTGILEDALFVRTFPWQANLFFFDAVFCLGHFFHVGNKATNLFQLAATTVGTGSRFLADADANAKEPCLTRNRDREPANKCC